MARTLWIARDSNGELHLFGEKPERTVWREGTSSELECFDSDDGYLFYYSDNDKDFPEVTWENSPQQVELKLKERNGEVGI